MKYDFGTMDVAAEQSHDFVIENVGGAPLKISAGATSCRCTVSDLERELIAPAESAKVTIKWKSKGRPGPYEQTAEITTNDPDRPQITLTVFGRITAAAQFVPAELILSRIASGEAATAETHLIYYLTEPLKITGHEWQETRNSSYFDVSTKPMTVEELKEYPEAQSGLTVKVMVKPGLPQGSFRQPLIFHTNIPSSPKITLPIEGNVASDIAIVGRDWDAESGILSLGTVPQRTGAKASLMLVVRGPLRKEVQFKAVQAVPDVLKVSLGKMTAINRGAVMETPLTIEVPPGSLPVNRLGSEQAPLGEVFLESTHPQVPKIRILVQFAVEG